MAEIDLDGIPEEQIAEALKGATDEQVQEGFRAVGVKDALDRTFHTMQEHFLPEKAEGVSADVQWVVTDQGEEFPYTASIADGKCTIAAGKAASPRVSLTMDLVTFVRLIMGQAQGPQLFMTGKLKVAGDLMFAQRVSGFFAQA
ncbi:MAG TPA: SCP2 sterol-binding domain-containing protein [Actinomycetota bacterium]|nr:SCP2 sterol-binding domain-containing protein [Actinomycetota bacterium]